MLDSQTNESVTSSKLEYENSIGLSQHVPQAKTISEMVLDAFHSTKESEQIRELRAAIRGQPADVLAGALNTSLETVRAACGALMQQGQVVRRGHKYFVA